jgi:UPF0271 protein
MESMLAAGLEVVSPAEDALGRVREAAADTGDDARLSAADADCVALVLELGGVLVTDDYSMQNVCSRLGVPYRPFLQGGIGREVRWGLRCRGCGRRFGKGEVKGEECPVCGSGLRQVPGK